MLYSPDDVCAIIVTFNPDARLLTNCQLLREQVGSIIIVDNGSSRDIRDFVAEAGLRGIDVICNGANIGLAAALNIGIRRAKGRYQWILTFDQDSIVTDSYVRSLTAAYQACPCRETVAIVAPMYRDQVSRAIETYRDADVEDGSLYANATTTMTSGNMVKASIFDIVGLFREDFFIDYVDNEFCLRCRDAGYKIIESMGTYLLHSAGTPQQHRLLWQTVAASNHSPLRRYYSTRNRIVVYRTYFTRYPAWVLRNIHILIKDIIKISLFEKDPIKKYCWMLRAVRDALLNRMGPLAVAQAVPATKDTAKITKRKK